MDDELGIKAPVTRLRRRLSTDAEGAQSPLTPSTPTKKRGTRIAKPALELIDENVTESVPKKVTRKTSTKDVETEEKPVTPSRRSTRIRSNTSLLIEATQNIVADSPRAKRALRRNSQIGSDTESASTPARRTRTRKDSTSSVEKLTVTNYNEKVIAQVAEAISEEPEKEITKDSKLDVSQNSPGIRKSPRISLKKKNTTDEPHKVENRPEQNDDAFTNLSKLTEDTSSSLNGLTTIEITLNTCDNIDSKYKSNNSGNQNISLNSAKLINEITNPKISNKFNKSVSAIEELNNEKGNRKRTKSWTTITTNDIPSTNVNSPTKFASGDKINEKNYEFSNKSIDKSLSIYNTSIENKKNTFNLNSAQMFNASDTIKILEKTPSKGIQSVVLMEDSDSNSSNGKLIIDMHIDSKSEKTDGGDQCVPVVKQGTPKRLTSESFVVEPMDIDETIPENVTFNDFSDKSNSSKEDIQASDLKQSSPFSKEKSLGINKSPSKSSRSSISLQPESNNLKPRSSITASEEIDNFKCVLDKSSISEKSQKKSSISVLFENDNFIDNANKSKRKSSLTKIDSDNDKRKSSTSSQVDEKKNESLNKSKRKSISDTEIKTSTNASDANKSTLVLSQLKDMSSNESNNVPKSPNNTNNKSMGILTNESGRKTQSNYSTSTPLQQKAMQKLALQMNTSIISPNVADTSKVNKSNTPLKNVSNVNLDSSSSEESDEDSREKNSIIDDEANEASEDYESGDSRDAEEKQYERDHEITEKGETLESDTNLSDDSDNDDYEKDSFVVSSDEDDDDLLSGSGDDLSLTDNELKMTAKSKKKFDERKRKEQKNASREMYQARHQVKESDTKSQSKSKKPKGKKTESSASESEEEVEIRTKKKNRLRIDSSHDVSMSNPEIDESVCVTKKKTKRRSESVYEGNINEKEITIQNQSVIEKNDPLVVAVKLEPKTPQKDFNMSTVLINENIEQVQVDTNASVMKLNESSDPLQAASDAESNSDISENMEIQENYDSVLENLNKVGNKQNKTKTVDTSLNLNNKRKDKIKDPIIEQLNLTQTKTKKNKTKNIAQKSENKTEVTEKQDDGDNSDSIDMRLLFPEDSNDSEVNVSKFKPDKNKEQANEFIPLKRIDAKTNIRENIGEPEDTSVNFFIDTKGAFEDIDITIQTSATKNKMKNKKNISIDNVEVIEHSSVTEDTSIDNSLKKDKKKKKKNKSFDVSQTDQEPVLNILEISARYEQSNIASEKAPVNVSTDSNNKKKKNKSHLDISQDAASEETPLNVSVKSEKKKKKNKSQIDVSQTVEDTVFKDTSINILMNSEKKKKKNMSQLDVSQIVDITASEETLQNGSMNSDKKKKNKSQMDLSQVVDAAPENVFGKSKKKNKKNKSQTDISHTSVGDDAAQIETINLPSSHKKKNNKSHNAQDIEENAVSEETHDIPQKKEKKTKKNKTLDVFQIIDNTGEDSDEAPMEVTYKSEKKSDNPEHIEDDDTLNKSKNKFKKKKKKVKQVMSQTDMNTEQDKAQAKKRKHEQSTLDENDGEVHMSKTQKKKKLFQNNECEDSSIKSIKRKATDDDDTQRKPKVFKKNFFEKVHVPRLPESIVDQLDDKSAFDQPKTKKSKKKKGLAISTMTFEVEEGPRRKNKPSNYLEQSVYLNDSLSPVQQKKKIKNPKVLPFTPTASTSGKGYTSKFKINVLPDETEHFAQAKGITNFREEFLSRQRAKKIRVERFKKHGNLKLAKF